MTVTVAIAAEPAAEAAKQEDDEDDDKDEVLATWCFLSRTLTVRHRQDGEAKRRDNDGTYADGLRGSLYRTGTPKFTEVMQCTGHHNHSNHESRRGA